MFPNCLESSMVTYLYEADMAPNYELSALAAMKDTSKSRHPNLQIFHTNHVSIYKVNCAIFTSPNSLQTHTHSINSWCWKNKF